MYRVVIARSGYYYVQQYSDFLGWKMTGGFFRTKRRAVKFIQQLKRDRLAWNSRVVGYY